MPTRMQIEAAALEGNRLKNGWSYTAKVYDSEWKLVRNDRHGHEEIYNNQKELL